MRIKEKFLRIIVKVLIVLVFLVIIGSFTFVAVRVMGKNNLYNRAERKGPDLSGYISDEGETKDGQSTEGQEGLTEGELQETEESWQEGDIRHQGKTYRYNEDILTFLVLGVDNMDKVSAVKNYTKGGQSDAMFLIVLNPHSKEISIIAINRDTMTEVAVYDKNNTYLSTVVTQLTLQHGYGDGKEISCERTVEAVSNLFYNLPIHGYCAVNMGAIPAINDSVGGVAVQLLEKIPYGSAAMQNEIGQTVRPEGMDAFWYLKYRDTKTFDSVSLRLARQKQYLSAFVGTAKEKTKADITFPVSLYNTISDYMVTNVTTSEISYLAPEVLNYSFNADDIYSLKGETVAGEKFEEFYPDEEALYELIIEVFYEPVMK